MPETTRPPTPTKPGASPFWKWVMRLTCTIAMVLFLAPTVYVVKYYAYDKPREDHHARLVSLARLAPSVTLDTVAPPLMPIAPGNAADYYVPAIQSFADRMTARRTSFLVPTPREAALILTGSRCRECQFFNPDPLGKPRYVFHDPDSGQTRPYRFPLTADEKYRYLGAAAGLAQAMTLVPRLPGMTNASGQETVGRAVVRFGAFLGQERATRTHLAVATAIERIGLRGLLARPTPALRRYVDSEQLYADAIQAKYWLLEPTDPDNLALQASVARADSDPLWRREAIWALGESLRDPNLPLRRPLETLTAKATLATIASRDPDISVREAAGSVLGLIARHGAVIRR